ncbi:MAG: endonuclease III [Candidatus Levybacteria bacterium RIFCSPHIGHO2_02_FULL_40_18]|nr:MAG: endonuclease III [Candidatus Levybacteria bacterium RIFCSPHIGHO2_01_FULL_40_58]OGH26361.1 MAG: endonuclease III [Candidatus Levybacteria bacterium RIFCSPHIGHO2_02_FULL_40_18]OGH31808.1 MAG: endonuclease III [Candidatus Levybacteria bacterium RIFCSPHIGHO2_12_FULL_40_31]OGH40441.1 MAG: endonuclease III [Candidatus Levybacteria bacterium RIFCSPLOWO2_01_FULL_40_64]OGH53084.1 MAG: endonuclease III [Candidatus Levybacteria bacterium RIFCSPLOWO2_12_FULL_40_10]
MDTKIKALRITRELKKLFPTTKTALEYKTAFQLLVAVVLSAQTTDKKVNEVTSRLFAKFKTAQDFSKLSQSELEPYIKSIGLYRGKAKNIIAGAKVISEKYDGEIPRSMKEMTALPGVGRKTANVVLGMVHGVVEGIAVDTHVRRLAQLFGLSKSSNPDIIERDLMSILPKKEWREFTFRMIDYGRKYCPASCKHINCPLRKYITRYSTRERE